MKIFQHSYNFAKRIWQKGSVPNWVMGFVLLFLTIAVVHQTKRLGQLEKRSSKAEVVLSRRSVTSPRIIHTKTDVVAGAIYTRWGRKSCPKKTSRLIYHGVVGGQYYTHTGGGSNVLCLPMEPIWGNYTDAEDGTLIYGGEYKIDAYLKNSPTGLLSNANSQVLNDHNVPCAVCQTLSPATIMMIPARLTCYPGWTLEYFGYLMSSHFGHKGRTEFLCIDQAPEADPAGYRKEGGIWFYHVQATCGALPCPPYVKGKELTCAVCSQSVRTHNHKFGFDNETKEMLDLQ